MLRLHGATMALGLAALWAAPAAAQQGAQENAQNEEVQWEDQQAPDSEVGWESEGSEDFADPSLEEEQASFGAEEARGPNDPYEDPMKSYYFLGAFYRHTWTPAFVLNLFLDEITTANNPGTGLEFTYRKDNLDITATAYWQRFHTYGPFLASGDPDTDTEMINSSLSTLAVGANFLWSTPFNDVVALQYGIDIGLGVVLGDLIRTEAYPTSQTAGDDPGAKAGFAPCGGVNDPMLANGAWCDGPSVDDGESGGHYNVKARRWTDGGSIPNVWFRFALPHIALRIKPIKQVVMRIDAGFDLFSGFFLGTAVSFGLN